MSNSTVFSPQFEDSFSEEIWNSTYRHHSDRDLADTFGRVAKAVAGAEATEEGKSKWEREFFAALSSFSFVPGGRILANAGTDWKSVGLINCFTGGRPDYDCDSIEGITKVLLEQALTLKSEGGWGLNFSFIRPRGAFIHGVGVETPGAVKYMEWFDKSSDIITAGSGRESTRKKKKGKIRKGAQMAILSDWHPDVLEFITAKQTPGRLSKFNMSVYCSNLLMEQVIKAKEALASGVSRPEVDGQFTWKLRFPDTKFSRYKEEWNGDIHLWESKGYPVIIYQTISALGLWETITSSTYNRNEPGVLFLDRANERYLFNYSGMKIFETNACCFSEESSVKVITNNGIKEIKEVTGDDLVWINEVRKFAKTSGYFKAGKQEVFRVKLTNGNTLDITANHKLCVPKQVREGSVLNSYEGKLVELRKLKVGDKICAHDTKVEGVKFGTNGDYNEGLVMGWLTGDGHLTFTNENEAFPRLRLDFWKLEHDLVPLYGRVFKELGYDLGSGSVMTKDKNEVKYFVSSKVSKDFVYKYQYNIWNFKSETEEVRFLNTASEEFIRGYLQAYFSADGTVSCASSTTKSVVLSSINRNRLLQVQSILALYGVKSSVSLMREAGETEFKNGGKYQTKDCWRLTITGKSNICKFKDAFGFINKVKNERLQEYANDAELRRAPSVCTIESIESIGTKETGCIEVPEYHKFTANGIISGNSEQTMPQFSSCNLLSINLIAALNSDMTSIDFEKLEKTSRTALRFSDNINTITIAPLPQYEKSIRDYRRVGIGILGWASLLYMLKIRFASDEAEALKKKIMATLCYSVIDESANLAAEKGMFVGCDPEKHADHSFFKELGVSEEIKAKIRKNGMRNSSLFSIQPTGNTSIFANIVSGGCEPIFMQEYIRTVIVPSVPAEIESVTPRYWEGEFKETSAFKFTKEGDELILRAEIDGIIYKIDKNRGLTKEVVCEDYAVRWHKRHGTWDKNAPWAVTTTNLSVDEHLRDMQGFTFWLDASCSKTVNIPNDYPYDRFQDIYLNAYKTGTIKGLTTYRAGTMTSVLSSVDTKDKDKETKDDLQISVKKQHAPKRPRRLKAHLYHPTLKGVNYYVAVGLLNDEPYEIFTGINSNKDGQSIFPKSIESGEIIKHGDGKYTFRPETEAVEYILSGDHTDSSADALTRMISTSLRHGVDIVFVVQQLEKTGGELSSFAKVLGRTLKRYIKEGTSLGDKCPSCGSKSVVRKEGCKVCTQCGHSLCG